MAMQTGESIQLLCTTLGVSRTGYYAHRQKPQRPRRVQDQKLVDQITPIFQQSRRTYGSPRIQAALRRAGERCGKNRVARLMRQQGLRARQKRRFRPVTTQSQHGLAVAENWLTKVPSPARPNQVWVSDITYLPTCEGWLYLAVILDACSRKVVGWHVDDHLETPLVTEALQQARQRRGLRFLRLCGQARRSGRKRKQTTYATNSQTLRGHVSAAGARAPTGRKSCACSHSIACSRTKSRSSPICAPAGAICSGPGSTCCSTT